MDQGPGVERCAVGPIVKMGQRLRDAGAQEIVGDLGSVAALLAGTQALSPGEAQPKQFGIVMGEADIGDAGGKKARAAAACRSEEHTSELQSLMRISYAVFCLKKKIKHATHTKQDSRKTQLHTTNTHTKLSAPLTLD